MVSPNSLSCNYLRTRHTVALKGRGPLWQLLRILRWEVYCGPQISQVSHAGGVRRACQSTGENVIHVQHGGRGFADGRQVSSEHKSGRWERVCRCWGKEQRSGLFPELPEKPALQTQWNILLTSYFQALRKYNCLILNPPNVSNLVKPQ